MTSPTVSSTALRHFFDQRRKRFPLQIIAFSLLLFCLSIHNGESEIVEIPLPELTGIYTIDTTRTAAFELSQPVTKVHQVCIQWSGTFTYGTGHGDGVLRPLDEWFPWPGQVCVHLDTPELDYYWDAYWRPEEGSFQDTAVFVGIIDPFDPNWNILSDGTGEVIVDLAPLDILGGVMVDSPVVELNTVFLILDVEFATSVENTSTWGQIKARFRTDSISP